MFLKIHSVYCIFIIGCYIYGWDVKKKIKKQYLYLLQSIVLIEHNLLKRYFYGRFINK